MGKKKNNKSLKKSLGIGAIFGIVIGIALLFAAYSTMTGSVIQSENVGENIPQEPTCTEFTEQALWSSGYSNNLEGSLEYHTWYPNLSCSDCILKDIEIKTRFIYTNPIETNKTGGGYVQISEPDQSICDNPEQGIYSEYLAEESLQNGEVKSGKYCNKNPQTKCGEEFTEDYGNVFCYGIKTYAPSDSITDVFEIKYKICSNE